MRLPSSTPRTTRERPQPTTLRRMGMLILSASSVRAPAPHPTSSLPLLLLPPPSSSSTSWHQPKHLGRASDRTHPAEDIRLLIFLAHPPSTTGAGGDGGGGGGAVGGGGAAAAALHPYGGQTNGSAALQGFDPTVGLGRLESMGELHLICKIVLQAHASPANLHGPLRAAAWLKTPTQGHTHARTRKRWMR